MDKADLDQDDKISKEDFYIFTKQNDNVFKI